MSFGSESPPWTLFTYSIARAHLADVMDRVCDNHETIIITRNGRQAVI
ncbi:MAG: type II toxin-antitoxin system Phd/YefM family antitoxin [Burkholderiales bacterium]|nr:type II toxin-antitoxin system Phd/YefM family antitoxin [Burkholderiales bacterium]